MSTGQGGFMGQQGYGSPMVPQGGDSFNTAFGGSADPAPQGRGFLSQPGAMPGPSYPGLTDQSRGVMGQPGFVGSPMVPMGQPDYQGDNAGKALWPWNQPVSAEAAAFVPGNLDTSKAPAFGQQWPASDTIAQPPANTNPAAPNAGRFGRVMPMPGIGGFNAY